MNSKEIANVVYVKHTYKTLDISKLLKHKFFSKMRYVRHIKTSIEAGTDIKPK